MRGNGVYRGIYLTPLEAELLERLASLNHSSRNFVMRCGLRALAGLPIPPMRNLDDEDAAESVGERLPARVSAP